MPDRSISPICLRSRLAGQLFNFFRPAGQPQKSKKHVKVKVWERGAGLTKACGTAACATAVSGSILQFNERCVDIEFAQGLLNIDWKKDNNIYMTGEVSDIKKILVKI